jgi:hypothetical protein
VPRRRVMTSLLNARQPVSTGERDPRQVGDPRLRSATTVVPGEF